MRDRVQSLLKKSYAPAGEPQDRGGGAAHTVALGRREETASSEQVRPQVADAMAAIRLAGEARRILPTSQSLRRLQLVALAQGAFDADTAASKAPTRSEPARRLPRSASPS